MLSHFVLTLLYDSSVSGAGGPGRRRRGGARGRGRRVPRRGARAAAASASRPSPALTAASQPDPNAQPNLNAIYTAPPVFVRSVPNASLYTVGGGEDTISVVHLWGAAGARRARSLSQ